MLLPSDTHKIDVQENARSPRDSQGIPLTGLSPSTNEFLLRLAASTGLRETSYVLATELRRIGECDRVVLLARRGTRWRVEAVSNLDHFDPRSEVVRASEEFARHVDPELGSAWIDDATPGDSDVALLARDFIEHTHSRVLGVLSLCIAPQSDSLQARCLGLILFERFTARPFDPDHRRTLEELSRHGAVAIARAAALEGIPLFRLLQNFSQVRERYLAGSGVRRLIAALVSISLLVVGAAWPISFVVTAPGTLQPVNRRELFAPADGVIQELKLNEDGSVLAGEVVVEIRSDEVEIELTRLSGDLETNRRRLQTIQAARLEAVRPETERTAPQGHLAAEEEQLKELIRGLEAQIDFRNKQREQLLVRSPISGKILTWDVERLLRARPVRRGQRLMTVADTANAWKLELQVADADVGHVLAAMRRPGAAPLTVSYRAASRPEVDQFGTLERVSDWTEVNEAGKPAVKMTATVPRPDLLDARPGAVTSAAIHLGTRPRAYVWLRQVVECVQMHFWF